MVWPTLELLGGSDRRQERMRTEFCRRHKQRSVSVAIMVLFFKVTDFIHLCYNILILLRRKCANFYLFFFGKKSLFLEQMLRLLCR